MTARSSLPMSIALVALVAMAGSFPLAAPTIAQTLGATELGRAPAPIGVETEAPPSKESPYAASVTVLFASEYRFQGIDYSGGRPVAQPEVAISAGPVTLKGWASHDLDLHVSDEVDISLEHGWTAGVFSGSTGYTYLRYPHREGWDPSQELYLSVAREGPVVTTSFSVRYDFDEGTGTYSALGMSRSVEARLGTLSLGGNLFYQSGYYDMTGFPSAEANLSLSHPVGPMSLTGSASRFVTWANGDFRDANAVRGAWVVSMALAREF